MCSAIYMCRWPLFAASMNYPGRIVEIEGGLIVKQRHMGFPVRLNGANVLPVPGKRIGVDTPALCHHRRNNVVSEVMLSTLVPYISSLCIINQDLNEGVTIKNIDTH